MTKYTATHSKLRGITKGRAKTKASHGPSAGIVFVCDSTGSVILGWGNDKGRHAMVDFGGNAERADSGPWETARRQCIEATGFDLGHIVPQPPCVVLTNRRGLCHHVFVVPLPIGPLKPQNGVMSIVDLSSPQEVLDRRNELHSRLKFSGNLRRLYYLCNQSCACAEVEQILRLAAGTVRML